MNKDTIEETFSAQNSIQPITDDFSSDGAIENEYARVDHQHALSPSLRNRLGLDTSSGGLGGLTALRNLAHNGQFNVKQRLATTVNPITAVGVVLADRFRAYNNTVGVAFLGYTTTTGFTGVPWTLPTPRPANIQYIQFSTADAALAAGDYLIYEQSYEGLSLQHLMFGQVNAKNTIVSFDCFSTVADTYVLVCDNITPNREISKAFSVAAGWNHVVISLPGDPVSVIPNNNGRDFRISIWIAVGTSYSGGAALNTSWATGPATNTIAVGVTNNLPKTVGNIFALTNFQWEIGTVPTNYEIMPFSQELSICERYLEVFDSVINNVTPFGAGMCYSATQAIIFIPFKTRKRANPTSNLAAANLFACYNSAGVIIAGTVVALNQIGQTAIQISITVAAGLLGGNGTTMVSNVSTASFIEIIAEL